jgi:uncharacterized protein (TIRG00374 family)
MTYFNKTKSFRQRLFFFIQILLAFVLLWVLFRLGLLQWEPLVSLFQKPLLFILFLCIAWISTYFLPSLRWWFLLRIQGIRLSLLEAFRISYVSAFIGTFLPGSISGDIIRVALSLNISQKQITIVTISVVIDRLLGLLGLVTLGVIAGFVYLNTILVDPSMYQFVMIMVIVAMAGILTAIIVGLFSTRLQSIIRQRGWLTRDVFRRFIAELIEAIALYNSKFALLVIGWGISWVGHSLCIVLLVLLAWEMGFTNLTMWEYAIAGSITLLVNAVPLTPSGLGVGESVFSRLALQMKPVAIPPPYATVMLVYRAVKMVVLIPAVFFAVGYLNRKY